MAQYIDRQDTEKTHCQPPEGPAICTNNCGFFGSAATMGMCSKCHKDYILTQAKASVSANYTADKSETILSTTPDQDPSQRKASRCFACKKRVALAAGIECRCGNMFCSSHRYSDQHSCTYDNKTAGCAAIAKANPVVIASKLDKL